MKTMLIEAALEQRLLNSRGLVSGVDKYPSVRSILSLKETKDDSVLTSKHQMESKLRKHFERLLSGDFLEEVGTSSIDKEEAKQSKKRQEAKQRMYASSSTTKLRKRNEDKTAEPPTCMQLFFLNQHNQGLKGSTRTWLEHRRKHDFVALELPVDYFDREEESNESNNTSESSAASRQDSLPTTPDLDDETTFLTSPVIVVDTAKSTKKSSKTKKTRSARSRADKGGVLVMPTILRNATRSNISTAKTA